MVAYAKLLADHLGHWRTRPKLSPEAMRAGAPGARSSGSLAHSPSLRRALAPGGGLCLRASMPSCLARLIHWLSAPLLTPRARAISCCLSSQARRRRPSRQSVACWLDSVFPIRLMISKFRCFTQRSVEGGRPGRPDGTEHGRRPVVPLRRRHRPAPRPPGLVPNALLPRAEEPSSAHQGRRGRWLDPKSLSARRTPVAPPLEMVPRQRPAGCPEVGSKSLLVTC